MIDNNFKIGKRDNFSSLLTASKVKEKIPFFPFVIFNLFESRYIIGIKTSALWNGSHW